MTQNAVWDAEEMASIQNKDRLLPSQPYFSKMYKGDDFYGDMESLLGSMYAPLNLDIETKDGLTYSCMGSDLNTLHFLQFLIRSHGYKNVLELGTYIGVSAMYMACDGVFVDTVEKGEEFFYIAKENIDKNCNKFAGCIFTLCDDAVKYLKRTRKEKDNIGLELMNDKYDLIFIDCAKESYKELLQLSLKKLKKNGMILVDDVFFQGETLSGNPTSEKGMGVKAMLDYVKTLDEYERVILPIGNGLLMVRKK